MGTKNQHHYQIGLGIVTFSFFFIFYTLIHPLYILDLDDWTYMVQDRHFYPYITWNPSRIFPEILMPFCGIIAFKIIYPFIGDLTMSMCYVTSFVISIFASIYILSFERLIRIRFNIEVSTTFFLSLIFLSLHFLIYRIKEANNDYMFGEADVTCYYYYIIPLMLCASIVMIYMVMEYTGQAWSNRSPIVLGIEIVFLYFSIFSNLYPNILLISYVFIALLTNFIRKRNRDYQIVYAIILTIWVFSALLETMG